MFIWRVIDILVTIVGKQWYWLYMDSVKYISIMKDYENILRRSIDKNSVWILLIIKFILLWISIKYIE